jgi:hypothetical protein
MIENIEDFHAQLQAPAAFKVADGDVLGESEKSKRFVGGPVIAPREPLPTTFGMPAFVVGVVW